MLIVERETISKVKAFGMIKSRPILAIIIPRKIGFLAFVAVFRQQQKKLYFGDTQRTIFAAIMTRYLKTQKRRESLYRPNQLRACATKCRGSLDSFISFFLIVPSLTPSRALFSLQATKKFFVLRTRISA